MANVYHGGLTPTAPDWRDVRSASKGDIRDAQTTIRKSGDRQPAVRRRTERCAAEITHCSATIRHRNKSGGRQPAVRF